MQLSGTRESLNRTIEHSSRAVNQDSVSKAAHRLNPGGPLSGLPPSVPVLDKLSKTKKADNLIALKQEFDRHMNHVAISGVDRELASAKMVLLRQILRGDDYSTYSEYYSAAAALNNGHVKALQDLQRIFDAAPNKCQIGDCLVLKRYKWSENSLTEALKKKEYASIEAYVGLVRNCYPYLSTTQRNVLTVQLIEARGSDMEQRNPCGRPIKSDPPQVFDSLERLRTLLETGENCFPFAKSLKDIDTPGSDKAELTRIVEAIFGKVRDIYHSSYKSANKLRFAYTVDSENERIQKLTSLPPSWTTLNELIALDQTKNVGYVCTELAMLSAKMGVQLGLKAYILYGNGHAVSVFAEREIDYNIAFRNTQAWPNDVMVCDAWSGIVCPASEFSDEFRKKMNKWTSRMKFPIPTVVNPMPFRANEESWLGFCKKTVGCYEVLAAGAADKTSSGFVGRAVT